MTPAAQKLFLEIARCGVMIECLAGESSSCKKVVLSQCPTLDAEARKRVWERKHHLPEPWVGHLEDAPLLFLSSNPFVKRSYDRSPAPPPQSPLKEFNGTTIQEHPSLGRPFEAPKAEWADDEIVDRFEAMFDVWTDAAASRPYTNQGKTLGAASPYWKAALDFATALLERPARPGIDYALTEIVRCKSSGEYGVLEAAAECVPRYLERTLALSPARVLVVLGRRARQVIRTMTGYAEYGPVSPALSLAGRHRTLVLLAHPSSRNAKYPKRLDDTLLAEVRSRL